MIELEAAVRANWRALKLGRRVRLAAGTVQHPRDSERFRPLLLAWPVGQTCNYGWSLDDGSRIHAHCFDGGVIELHRDRWDPAAGVVPAIMHGALETPIGRALVLRSAVGLQAAAALELAAAIIRRKVRKA
jgi:hypothetical protein